MAQREKKEIMHVAAIREGIVIDHIPPEKLFEVASLLHLETVVGPITIGNNLESRELGKKGIIKVADVDFSEELLSRIAIVAPNVKLNIIRDYEVVEKRRAKLPTELVGIIHCPNERCITNNEPMQTRFITLQGEEQGQFTCHYCGRKISAEKIELI